MPITSANNRLEPGQSSDEHKDFRGSLQITAKGDVAIEVTVSGNGIKVTNRSSTAPVDLMIGTR